MYIVVLRLMPVLVFTGSNSVFSPGVLVTQQPERTDATLRLTRSEDQYQYWR